MSSMAEEAQDRQVDAGKLLERTEAELSAAGRQNRMLGLLLEEAEKQRDAALARIAELEGN